MKKVFLKIHLWLSFPLGIIVTLICLSGAILVFQDEIEEYFDPGKFFVEEVGENPMPIGRLIKIANSRLEDNTVASVQVPSDPGRNYILGLKEGNRALVYINPFTAEFTGKSERGEGFFSVIQRLHRWLLGSRGSIGQSIVGYTTLILVIILLTGIIIWIPKSKKQWKNRMQIKTKYGAKRFWMDLHTSGGIYIVIGLLVLSLTGLYYSFEWYRNGLYAVLGVEMTDYHTQGRTPGGNPNFPKENRTESHGGNPNYKGRGGNPHYRKKENLNEEHNDSVSTERRVTEYNKVEEGQNIPDMRRGSASSWQTVLDNLKENNPDFKSITLQSGSATVVQNFTFGNARASDRYTFDNETGEILKSQLYNDQDASTKVRGWIYSLHTGKWGGILSKVLTCIVALAGATLPLTGYYIFYVKRKKKFRKKNDTYLNKTGVNC